MSNLGDWIKEKWKTQAAIGEKLGVAQGRVSKWVLGTEGISEDYQARFRKLGYTGLFPREEAQEAAVGGPAPYVTREEYGALLARLDAAEKTLKEAQASLVGTTGAIRQLGLKVGLPEIEALLK